MRATTLIVLALVLSGCETYYKVPDAQPTAKVRFRSVATGQAIMVSTFANDKCDKDTASGIMGVVGGISRDPLGNVPPQIRESGNTLGMIGYNTGEAIQPIERPMRADRPFVFGIQRIQVAGVVVKTCNISMSFVPQPDAQYEVVYSEDATRCYVNAFRLQPDGAKVERLPERTTSTATLCR